MVLQPFFCLHGVGLLFVGSIYYYFKNKAWNKYMSQIILPPYYHNTMSYIHNSPPHFRSEAIVIFPLIIVFVCWHKPRHAWEEGISIGKCLHQIGPWACLWAFSNCLLCNQAQPTVGMGKVTGGGKQPRKQLPACCLLQYLLWVPAFPWWWPATYKPKKLFPPQVGSGQCFMKQQQAKQDFHKCTATQEDRN